MDVQLSHNITDAMHRCMVWYQSPYNSHPPAAVLPATYILPTRKYVDLSCFLAVAGLVCMYHMVGVCYCTIHTYVSNMFWYNSLRVSALKHLTLTEFKSCWMPSAQHVVPSCSKKLL